MNWQDYLLTDRHVKASKEHGENYYRNACLSVPLFFSPHTLLFSSFCPAALLYHKNHAGWVFLLLNTIILKSQWIRRKVITILSLRPISSSSSLFLCSKWTSIRVCSSRRSFSILFLWISYQEQLDPNYLMLFYRCSHVFIQLIAILREHTSKSTLSPSGILGAASCVTSGLWNNMKKYQHICFCFSFIIFYYTCLSLKIWQHFLKLSVSVQAYLYLGRSSSTWQSEQRWKSESVLFL